MDFVSCMETWKVFAGEGCEAFWGPQLALQNFVKEGSVDVSNSSLNNRCIYNSNELVAFVNPKFNVDKI